MQTVLVAGAAGYLGRHIVVELKRRGYRVRAFVRDGRKLKQTGPFLEPAVDGLVDEVFEGDATRPETLHGLCRGVDLVVSAMGLTHPDARMTPESVDHQGNRRILEQALEAGVGKFVYVSVFHVGEMMEVETVRAHEAFVRDLESSGMEYAVVRPNGYFSDMAMFLKAARVGFMVWIGDGRSRINPIHGADLAGVTVDALEGTEREVEAGGPETFSYRELLELAFEALGKKPRILFIPLRVAEAVLSVIGRFSPKLAALGSFAVAVAGMDNCAPPHGSRRLEAFYRELSAREKRNHTTSHQEI